VEVIYSPATAHGLSIVSAPFDQRIEAMAQPPLVALAAAHPAAECAFVLCCTPMV